MVTDSGKIIDATRRRIATSYRFALAVMVLTLVMIALISSSMLLRQMEDMKEVNIADMQRMLSQRIALFMHELPELREEGRRREQIQVLYRSIAQMENNHHTLMKTLHEGRHSQRVADIYYHPQFMLDARMRRFLENAKTFMKLPEADATIYHPSAQAVISEAQGELLVVLDDAVGAYQENSSTRMRFLFLVIVGLCTVALLMIAVVVITVLRPAISHVAQAQQKLLELNQLKGDFLANMSHEIRTPMNGIFGMTELLLDSGLTERQHHYARTLQNSADYLLGLINDILDFSKLEAGQMKLDPIHFNLMATIEDVLELLSPRAREKNLELLLHYAPGAPHFVVADPGRIRQVLFNLMGNAIKFTDKGYVMVHVEILKGERAPDGRPWLKIRIEDTGIGIPENKLSGLFEKFTQVESGSTRARQGTGLGLAISRNLVRLMGGDIYIASTPGQGTTFSWQIPLPDALEQQPSYERHAILSGKRVLLVDDLAPNRALFREALMESGVECLVGENASEALSILAYEHDNKRQLHAVITDYLMPETDGAELCRAITSDKRYGTLPVIIFSSANEQGLVKRFVEVGASACLTKPVTRQQMLDMLGHVLEAAAKGKKQSIITADTSQAMSAQRLLAKERPLYGTRILLVEDNKVNLEIASELLTQFGCEVTTAMDGIKAIEAVQAAPFDLVFMDCQMPEMDGFEAARRIVELKAAGKVAPVPIVALTANALKGDRERCLESGMDDYLSKPVRKANLEAILLKWLRGKLEARAQAALKASPVRNVVDSAVEKASMPATPVEASGIDLSAFNAAREMLGAKLSTVLGFYLEDAQGYIDVIARAVENNDLKSAMRPAHTLKSSSLQFGVVELAQLSARIEKAAIMQEEGQPPENAAALILPMRQALQKAQPFLASAMAA